MTKDWDPLRDEIKQLYQVEDRKLIEVMRIIQGRHGFKASERSYRTQMRKWGYMKYSTEDFPKPNRNSHPSRKRLGSASAVKGVRAASALPLAADSFNPRRPSAGMAPGLLPGPDGASPSYMNGAHSLNLDNHVSRSFQNTAGTDTEWPTYTVFHQSTSNRRTDLHLAVLGQDEQQVQRLLFDGFCVKDEDNVSNQPLHYAMNGTSENIVSLLIKYGADVNAKGQLGRSPLHLAVSKVHFTRHLLTAGADANLQDKNGDTPVHLAVLDFVQKKGGFSTQRSLSALYAMIDAKCDLNSSNLAGMTPFHGLLTKDPPHSGEGVSESQLHCLYNGASPTQPYPDARTPLQVLLSYDLQTSPVTKWGRAKCDVIRFLIEKGADPQTKFPSGKTLVSEYFERTRWETYGYKPDHGLGKALCKHADLMPLSGSDGRLRESLLHTLAKFSVSGPLSGTFDIVALFKAVLQRGADPNLPDKEGKTPLLLLFPTKGNVSETVLRARELMMKQGGNPFIADSSGKSPVRAASEVRQTRLSVDYVYHLLKSTLDSNEISSAPRERESSARECRWNDWDSAASANDWDQAMKIIRDSQPTSICRDSGMGNLRKGAYTALAERHLKALDTTLQSPEETLQRRKRIAQILHDCQSLDVKTDMRYYHELVRLSL
ncbi:ankyrin repeat-containing domain protein [Colletotrichum godetiae]|uniref:Ankyrin repeat-containing domain protein n=1 Tax=Colletotrichum godetiae TaxID=1209918 RepID=A0AAJ0AAX3_9PEZI|nr:ankyrin repeat-containing domain protein [Colletotrichum godetiae]KAK1658237.1 ankyrin repeat-containing domain protein [Colletotrichum godetiae]